MFSHYWTRISLCLGVLAAMGMSTLSNPALGQESIAGTLELDKAISSHLDEVGENRANVLELFQNSDVRKLVGDLGFDIQAAESAVHTLEADELAMLQSTVKNIDRGLSGGDQTISISVVTLLLIIIIVILLA